MVEISGGSESSICEIVKKEKEIRASFAAAPQTADVAPEKAFSWCVEDGNTPRVEPEVTSLLQACSKGSLTRAMPGHLLPLRDSHGFGNRFGLQTIKIPGGRERERVHTHITLITVPCDNSPILLLVIVNL